jgi:ABC-type bacteriocin/lantibiotic exporter with double-glycine peptidase domain
MPFIKKIFLLIDNKDKKKLFIIIFFIVFGAVLEMISVGMVFPLLKIISDPSFLHNYNNYKIVNFLTSSFSNINIVYIILFLFLIIFYVKNFFLSFVNWLQFRFSTNLNISFSKKLFNGYLSRRYSSFIAADLQFMMKSVSHDTLAFSNSINAICYLIIDSLFLILLLIFLVTIEPKGSFFLILFFFIFIKLYSNYSQKKLSIWSKLYNQNEKNKLSIIQQSFFGIREIKINSKLLFFFKIFNIANHGYTETLFKRNILQATTRLYIEVISVTALVFFIIAIDHRGSIEKALPTLGLFAAAAFKMLPTINRILISKQLLKFIDPILERFSRDVSDNLINYENIKNSSRQIIPKIILFKNVGYYYTLDKKIFNNLNLEIPLNRNIGIIGQNGSGKSTFLDMLCGLTQPTTGTVKFNNSDISAVRRFFIRNAGYVSQSPFILDDTVLTNITFEKSNYSKEKLNYVLNFVNLNDFINNLPEGINTVINGSKISGGQKQKIGIARALYKNPKILILDEATNAIDEESEKKIINNLLKINKKTKLIIVSHASKILKLCSTTYKIHNKNIMKIRIKQKKLY